MTSWKIGETQFTNQRVQILSFFVHVEYCFNLEPHIDSIFILSGKHISITVVGCIFINEKKCTILKYQML